MRCYNGCPDTELQNHLNHREEVRRQIHALGYTVTYFPNGEFYQAFKDYQIASGEHQSLDGVLLELQRRTA